jgi:uncharacterized membrane protein YdcZ (DUF606 family)
MKLTKILSMVSEVFWLIWCVGFGVYIFVTSEHTALTIACIIALTIGTVIYIIGLSKDIRELRNIKTTKQ